MKNSIYVLVLIILFSNSIFAQKTPITDFSAVDKKALALPDSISNSTDQIASHITNIFQTETDRVRAAFIWIATNIKYDLDNMFAINLYETRSERIAKVLKVRKGICEHYAALFSDICSKMGVKSYVVDGYVKQNGFVDFTPHAWSASLVEGNWYLFDPTWAAGALINGKYVKKINNEYFMVSPSKLIKSHMPFDYLWQLLSYPYTSQEFYDGKQAINLNKEKFNYLDSIIEFEKMDKLEQLNIAAYRIEKNGVKNSPTHNQLHYLKSKIEYEKQNITLTLFNLSLEEYNEAIKDINEFIYYRNKQFVPFKSDPEIQSMLDRVEKKINSAIDKMSQIATDPTNGKAAQQNLKTMNDLKIQLTEQQEWLKQYFSKDKMGRKSMFYKVTWFGIPLN